MFVYILQSTPEILNYSLWEMSVKYDYNARIEYMQYVKIYLRNILYTRYVYTMTTVLFFLFRI